MPPGIANLLDLLRILIAYGQNLVATIEHRSKQRSFGTIAKGFGTAHVPIILARLSRGLLRAMALQHVLLARAKRGRDLVVRGYPEPKSRTEPADQDTAGHDPSEQDQADAPPQRKPRDRVDTYAPPDPANMPTLAQLIAQIRRHAPGRVLADICQDLGIIPTLCHGIFLGYLTNDIGAYRGSVRRWFKEYRRREQDYLQEQFASPAFDMPASTRAAIREILGGFFIGEPIPDPFVLPGLVPEGATGPP